MDRLDAHRPTCPAQLARAIDGPAHRDEPRRAGFPPERGAFRDRALAQQTQSGLFAAFSPDGRRVITGDVVIAAVKIWDLSVEGDAEVINVPTDHEGPVDVAHLPDGLLVASHDLGSVSIWNVDGDTKEPSAILGPAGGSDSQVFQVATSPEGERVAIVRDFSSVVSVWNVGSGTLAFEHDVRTGGITSVDWSGDGRYLAVGTWDDDRGSVYVLDADEDGRHILDGSEPDPVRGIAIAPDGGRSPPPPTTNRIRTRATCRYGTRWTARSCAS